MRRQTPVLRRFLKHTALVLVPVLVLAGFAIWSLRWEQAALRAERSQHLDGVAHSLLKNFESRLGPWQKSPPSAGSWLPVPTSESPAPALGPFDKGELETVIGQGASTTSEAGLPLRPLAALQLLRRESNPQRLAELTALLTDPPSILTSMMLQEAEQRHHDLELRLPPTLVDWRSRLTCWENHQRLITDLAKQLEYGSFPRAVTHLATMYGHLAVLRQLLEAGADRKLVCDPFRNDPLLPRIPSNLLNAKGTHSLLDLALIHNRAAIIDLLLDGKPEEVDALLNRTGPIVNDSDFGEKTIHGAIKLTPFQLALWLNQFELATQLAEKGAKLDPVGDDEQPSALYFAACWRRPFVKWILAHGADPNLGHSKTGATALHELIRQHEFELAQAVLEAGADANSATKQGSTPLHFARAPEAVTLLLENGAKINAEREGGITPLEQLGISGLDEPARAAFHLLLDKGATCTNPERLATQARFLLPDVLEMFVYPKAFNPNTIRVVHRNTRAQLVDVETRPTESASPPPLGDVLAVYYLGRKRESQRTEGPVGSLRVLRSHSDGGFDTVFTARGAEVAKAEFPELQWGDLVEVNVLLGAGPECPADSPSYATLLSSRVKPRQVAFRIADIQTVLTLHDKTSSNQFLKSWESIDLHSLSGNPFARIYGERFTIQREGLEDLLSFDRSNETEFRLVNRDRVTIHLASADKGVFLFRMTDPLNPLRLTNMKLTLLETLEEYASGGSPVDWKRVECHHATTAGLKRGLDIDELVRTHPRGQWPRGAWDKLDYTLRDGCMIVLHPLPASATDADKARSTETTKLLKDIRRSRGGSYSRIPKLRTLP